MIQIAVAPPSTPAEMFLFLHRNTSAAAKQRIEMNASGTIIHLRLHSFSAHVVSSLAYPTLDWWVLIGWLASQFDQWVVYRAVETRPLQFDCSQAQTKRD
jgi:hypothetical protein